VYTPMTGSATVKPPPMGVPLSQPMFRVDTVSFARSVLSLKVWMEPNVPAGPGAPVAPVAPVSPLSPFALKIRRERYLACRRRQIR
jgi:hypothetical protein